MGIHLHIVEDGIKDEQKLQHFDSGQILKDDDNVFGTLTYQLYLSVSNSNHNNLRRSSPVTRHVWKVTSLT